MDLNAKPTTSEQKKPAAFVTTQWTRVLQARGDSQESKAALSDLCAAYYEPVFAFIRRNAIDEESARELTQEFFARLLARDSISRVDPKLGRFRSFLLAAVKHFLADRYDYEQRLKRGAGQSTVSIEAASDTSPGGAQLPDARTPSPDLQFDRKWALTLLDRALVQLARVHEESGKAAHFEVLKPWLTGDGEEISQADAAAQLGMNEGAVKVAVHRLRRRFRELIRNEIGQTVSDPAQVDQELHCLFQALL